MAERIVILGWGGEAIELYDAMDAAAFVDTGMCRASLTKWGGPLANATVLIPERKYLDTIGGENEKGYTQAWAVIRKLVRPAARNEFVLTAPIPVGEGVAS